MNRFATFGSEMMISPLDLGRQDSPQDFPRIAHVAAALGMSARKLFGWLHLSWSLANGHLREPCGDSRDARA